MRGLALLAVMLMLSIYSLFPTPGRTQPPGVLKQQIKQQEALQRERERTIREALKDRPAVPTDEKLLSLMKDFVEKSLKLAQDYEKAGDLEKARAAYIELLHMVPTNPQALQALDAIRRKEESAMTKTVEIHADKHWQDSGVIVTAGKPITITAKGTWTLNIKYELGAEGVPIPKELRDFNLGSLVAVISTGAKDEELEPFPVESGKTFVAKKTGRLGFRIYDIVPEDNKGKLDVTIQGTFKTLGGK